MKYHTKISLIFLFSLLVLLIACDPDDDENIDQRDKYLGAWNCTETSSQNPNPITFQVSISKDELTENEIKLSNFYHLGFEEKTRIIVDFSDLSIPQQTVCNLTVTGSGAYTQNKVNLIYYVNDGADIDTVNALLAK